MITSSLPAEALDTDVTGVLAARGPIHHFVSELIVDCAPYHPAEQLAPVLQQNSTVLGHPAHTGKQAVDVKMLPVVLGALLLSEVPLLREARLRVAGPELHPAPCTVLAAVFWLWSVALPDSDSDAPSTRPRAGSEVSPASPGSIGHGGLHFFGNTKSKLAVLSGLTLGAVGPGRVLRPAALVPSLGAVHVTAPKSATLHHIWAHLRTLSKDQFTLFIHVVKEAWQLGRQSVGSGFGFIQQTLAMTSV